MGEVTVQEAPLRTGQLRMKTRVLSVLAQARVDTKILLEGGYGFI
jgi:hypothetical protein